jgi:hypothetical protein
LDPAHLAAMTIRVSFHAAAYLMVLESNQQHPIIPAVRLHVRSRCKLSVRIALSQTTQSPDKSQSGSFHHPIYRLDTIK